MTCTWTALRKSTSAAPLCGPSPEPGTSQSTGPASRRAGTAGENQTPAEAGGDQFAAPRPPDASQPQPRESRLSPAGARAPRPRPAPGSRRGLFTPRRSLVRPWGPPPPAAYWRKRRQGWRRLARGRRRGRLRGRPRGGSRRWRRRRRRRRRRRAALAVLLYRAAGQRAVPAVLGSAGLVFLVGEVVPAAVSGRWTLALAPRALILSRLAVLLTLPVALPVGQLLELAARPGRLRERVLELARGGGDPYSDLSKGVLPCRTVEDVLTPLEDCFMLDASTVLDFGVLASIMQSGHTRIPVYEGERSNIVDMLYLKDLAFVDPEDCTPLSTITRFYSHPLHFVFNDTKLDAVLEEFKRGNGRGIAEGTRMSAP
eukprot:bmy_06883T0